MRVIYVVAFVIIYLELFSVPFSFMTLGLAGNALDFTSIIKDAYSSYNLLFSINAQEKNIEKFGLINSTTIDLVRTIFGFEEKAVIENDGIDEVKNGKQNEVDGEEANEPEEPTYNVTVSGHAPYNYGSGNSTATRYKAETENLPYSTPVKAYLATQMELDRALGTLINKLNEVSRAHNADKNIPPSSGYERFLDNTFNSKYLKNMYNNNWK